MKLFTWKSAGEWKYYKIEYIPLKQCSRNSVRDMKTLPGTDIDSDHNLLVVEGQTRLKAIRETGNLEKFKSKENYVKEGIKQKFSQIYAFTGSVKERWW